MIKTIVAEPILDDEQAEALKGEFLNRSHIKQLIDYDCDVYKPNGEPLLFFRKRIIPREFSRQAYLGLRKAAGKTDNRGMAAGKLKESAIRSAKKAMIKESEYFYNEIKEDGTISSFNRGNVVESGVVGYLRHKTMGKLCRQTAFTQKNLAKVKLAYPLLRFISDTFGTLVPERFQNQKGYIEKTVQDFYIPGTVFTTVTVNRNFQTAVHTDKGDLKEGFGNLTVLQKGYYSGGYTVFPQFGIGVNCRMGDLLLMDVHEWHGNTEIVAAKGGERISLVCYYRRDILTCKTAQEQAAVLNAMLKKGDD